MNQLCDTGCGTAAYLAIENRTLTLATGVFVNWEMNLIFYFCIYICLNAEADRLLHVPSLLLCFQYSSKVCSCAGGLKFESSLFSLNSVKTPSSTVQVSGCSQILLHELLS